MIVEIRATHLTSTFSSSSGVVFGQKDLSSMGFKGQETTLLCPYDLDGVGLLPKVHPSSHLKQLAEVYASLVIVEEHD